MTRRRRTEAPTPPPTAPALDDPASYAADAAEVLRDLPGWQDDEPVEMRVGALRALLAGVGAGRAAA